MLREPLQRSPLDSIDIMFMIYIGSFKKVFLKNDE